MSSSTTTTTASQHIHAYLLPFLCYISLEPKSINKVPNQPTERQTNRPDPSLQHAIVTRGNDNNHNNTAWPLSLPVLDPCRHHPAPATTSRCRTSTRLSLSSFLSPLRLDRCTHQQTDKGLQHATINQRRRGQNNQRTNNCVSSWTGTDSESCPQILRQACLRETPQGAMCVQNIHDSRGLAIRITYRISLRSSSLWEPRHPPLKVVSARYNIQYILLHIIIPATNT